MKILVTGATGFIGNHLIHKLLRHHVEVIATSRNPEKAKQCRWYDKVTYMPWNLDQSQENIFMFFRQPDILIHLAWEGLADYKNEIHIKKNISIHYDFIKNMVYNGLTHVLVTGTCLEYGLQEGCLSEDLVTKPTTAYGLGKDTMRNKLQRLAEEYDFVFQWARLFYVYGEGQSKKSLLSQLNAAVREGKKTFNMSGGEQLRDFVSVEMAVRYLAAVAFQKDVRGVINCCSGTPISVRNFVEEYIKQKGYSIQLCLGHFPYPDYEPMAFWGNNRKLQKVLDVL